MTNMRRTGTTLPELLTVLVLLSLVLALFLRALQRQQRFYGAVGRMLEQRGQLRQATTLLPAQLRSISTAAGDLLVLSDSALELRTHLGVGILCDTVPGGGAFVLAPDVTRNGITLAAYVDLPQRGDDAFVYDGGPDDGAADDRWLAFTVATAAFAGAGCDSSALLDRTTDAGRPRLHVTLEPGRSLGPTVHPGAVVRFTRRARFRLYRSGADWYVGYAARNGSAFTTVQPVSGPYRPYAPPGLPSGLAFRYFDSAGIANPAPAPGTPVARVEITVRGSLGVGLRRTDLAPGGADDSLAVTVAPRNRR